MRRIGLGLALVAVIVVGSVVTYRHFDRGSPSAIAVESPVRTTEAWFAAVNARDMTLAKAHFAPASRDQMNWSSWGQPFINLHCSLKRHNRMNAEVLCTFDDQNDPSTGMSDVDFWTVELTRAHDGPWLIINYGQG
ncbi:MAG: hypothetical protein WCF25_13160 [Acidimicrobiales bacterium]